MCASLTPRVTIVRQMVSFSSFYSLHLFVNNIFRLSIGILDLFVRRADVSREGNYYSSLNTIDSMSYPIEGTRKTG